MSLLTFFAVVCLFLLIQSPCCWCYPRRSIRKTVAAAPKPELYRVCYFTNWSQYRSGEGRFTVANIEPSLCSHIIFAFAEFSNRSTIQLREWNDEVLMAIGGWNLGSKPFSEMVANQESRSRFINDVVPFLRERHLDGLDVDWEYPAARGSPPEDKGRFTKLLKELKSAFRNEANSTKQETLLLTAAVAAGKTNIDAGYEIWKIAKYLDFFNLMTFDYHGPWNQSEVSGMTAPFAPRISERRDPVQRTLNVQWSVEYWLQNGAPAHKLILGIPAYAWNLKLVPNNHRFDYDVGKPICGRGREGPFTNTSGFLSFYEICSYERNDWKSKWHNEHRNAMAYGPGLDQWLGYDSIRTVSIKANYAARKGLGGIMLWALDMDDFIDICGHGVNYPLLRSINEAFGVKKIGWKRRKQTKPRLPKHWDPFQKGKFCKAGTTK